MLIKHWQQSDKPQQKGRKTPKFLRRKRRQLRQLAAHLR